MRPADLDDLCGLQAAAGCRVPAPGRWGLQHAVGSCWRRGSEADPGSAGPLPQSVLPPVSRPRAVGTGPPVVGAGRRHPRVGRAPRRQHVRIRGREQRPMPPRVGRGPGRGSPPGGPAPDALCRPRSLPLPSAPPLPAACWPRPGLPPHGSPPTAPTFRALVSKSQERMKSAQVTFPPKPPAALVRSRIVLIQPGLASGQGVSRGRGAGSSGWVVPGTHACVASHAPRTPSPSPPGRPSRRGGGSGEETQMGAFI